MVYLNIFGASVPMRRDTHSRTAEAMALVRAIEQTQSPSRRIIDDPYAPAFLFHPFFRLVGGSRVLSRFMLRFLDWWAPGGQELLTIRPRLVDDLAREQAAEGLEQIVLLGAGFDTMAWRLKDFLKSVTVYEVDHPLTQAPKREVAGRLGVPATLRFVPVDFEREDFSVKLREAGFDAARKTLMVWVGVSYYLTAPAVEGALRQIAGMTVPGSVLVWDYMLAEVIEGTSSNREALGKAARVAMLGEPWLFGLTPESHREYLASLGFSVRHDYDPEELRRRYAPQRPLPMSYVRIAVAERV